MIMVAGLALILISVWQCGGQFTRLGSIRPVGLSIAALALLIQLVILNVLSTVLPTAAAEGLHLMTYAMAASFVVLNRKIRGLPWVAVGGGMNLFAIAANDGIMPASPWALTMAGHPLVATDFDNSQSITHAKAWFLGDIFPWPHPLPLANVFSLGDIVLLVGIALVLHHGTDSRLVRRAEPDEEPDSGTFDLAMQALHILESLNPSTDIVPNAVIPFGQLALSANGLIEEPAWSITAPPSSTSRDHARALAIGCPLAR